MPKPESMVLVHETEPASESVHLFISLLRFYISSLLISWAYPLPAMMFVYIFLRHFRIVFIEMRTFSVFYIVNIFS